MSSSIRRCKGGIGLAAARQPTSIGPGWICRSHLWGQRAVGAPAATRLSSMEGESCAIKRLPVCRRWLFGCVDGSCHRAGMRFVGWQGAFIRDAIESQVAGRVGESACTTVDGQDFYDLARWASPKGCVVKNHWAAGAPANALGTMVYVDSPNSLSMNWICRLTPSAGSHRTCPFRIMWIAS